MITYKEIKRRFKSQETKDIQWVVNTAMIVMGVVTLALAGFIIYNL